MTVGHPTRGLQFSPVRLLPNTGLDVGEVAPLNLGLLLCGVGLRMRMANVRWF